jgi:hypothetical protein
MKGILFKKHKATDEHGIGDEVIACDDFGIMPLSHPFAVQLEQKELPTNDWLDEDGDDEFVPDKPCFKSFEDEVEFGIEADTPQDALGVIAYFIIYLSFGGAFAMYDEHTEIGYEDVRFVKLEPTADKIEKDGKSIIQFKVVFKVNSPISFTSLERQTNSANVENIRL